MERGGHRAESQGLLQALQLPGQRVAAELEVMVVLEDSLGSPDIQTCQKPKQSTCGQGVCTGITNIWGCSRSSHHPEKLLGFRLTEACDPSHQVRAVFGSHEGLSCESRR